MNRIVVFLFLSPLFCVDTHAQDIAVIRFVNKDSIYDFGPIVSGDQPVYEFKIENTGNTALIITGMKSETGDFKFNWPGKPLKPHKKARISVTYSPKGLKNPGSFKSDIFITSNATQQPYPFIRVSGAIVLPHGAPMPSPPHDGLGIKRAPPP